MAKNNISPKSAVTAALKAAAGDTVKVNEALIICFTALPETRNTSEINRLILEFENMGRHDDARYIRVIGENVGPLRAVTSDPDKKDAPRVLAFRKARKGQDETPWNVDTLRGRIDDHRGSFRALAAAIAGSGRVTPQKALSELLAALHKRLGKYADGEDGPSKGYPAATLAAIQRAANSVQTASNSAAKAEREAEAAKAEKADKAKARANATRKTREKAEKAAEKAAKADMAAEPAA